MVLLLGQPLFEPPRSLWTPLAGARLVHAPFPLGDNDYWATGATRRKVSMWPLGARLVHAYRTTSEPGLQANRSDR